MIRSYANAETEAIANGEKSRKFPADIQRGALKRIQYIQMAGTIDDLRHPSSNRLEKLHGDREGQWSIRVNSQWRICFAWNFDAADDVELVDYH